MKEITSCFMCWKEKNIDWIGILYWNTGFKNDQILVLGICLKITHKLKKTGTMVNLPRKSEHTKKYSKSTQTMDPGDHKRMQNSI